MNREAHAESVTVVTLPERSIKSSSEILNPPAQPTLSRDATAELAMTIPKNAKAIRRNQRNLAVMRHASHRISTVDKRVLRSVNQGPCRVGQVGIVEWSAHRNGPFGPRFCRRLVRAGDRAPPNFVLKQDQGWQLRIVKRRQRAFKITGLTGSLNVALPGWGGTVD